MTADRSTVVADVRPGGAAGTLDPVLMADDRVTAVPVVDCGEPLVDVVSILDRARLDSRCADRGATFRRVRQGVAQRLSYAESLLPDEVSLLVVECHRTRAVQTAYFDEYRAALSRINPGWDEDRVFRAASRYISPPAFAPHVAGAAVDLTLCSSDGTEWEMGTRVNADPEESDGACYTRAAVSELARGNRALMADALSRAGFVNYPTEWWHWSFGDRYWAQAVGAPYAIYGPMD